MLLSRGPARGAVLLAAFAAALALWAPPAALLLAAGQDPFRFKSGIELVNVTATVSDANGRFVPGLRQEDFIVYEDDVPQSVTQFSAERVPVSLGIALDTSGSMAGEKIDAARGALNRFVFDLLDERDEVFLYRFGDTPVLLQGWTDDRPSLARALGRTAPDGGTAMYDTVARAVPMAEEGRHQKKALVVISDGNDTSSRVTSQELKQIIRQSDVLIYAVGIDGTSTDPLRRRPPTTGRPPVPRGPTTFPPVFPGGPPARPPRRFPVAPSQIAGLGGAGRNGLNDDRVNVDALRELTDESGGRTEIVRSPGDLDPATASIADELSKQYYLGYTSTGSKDGRWHSIRVEMRASAYRVRARRGFIAN